MKLSGNQTLRYRNRKGAASGSRFHKLVEDWVSGKKSAGKTGLIDKGRLARLGNWLREQGLKPLLSEARVSGGRLSGYLDLVAEDLSEKERLVAVEIKTGYRNLWKGRDRSSRIQQDNHVRQISLGCLLWNEGTAKRGGEKRKIQRSWLFYTDVPGAVEVTRNRWESYRRGLLKKKKSAKKVVVGVGKGCVDGSKKRG